MAEFDRETKKKLHRIWVVIASILMTLSVVLIVVVTTLLALGYSFNGKVIQQTGVLQLHTTPTGATVTVDVCTRPDVSVSGTRCTRCVPASSRSQE